MSGTTNGVRSTGPSDSCKGWAKKYDWRRRASAYDDHIRRLRREAQEQGMAEEAERQGREVERLRADMLTLAKRHYEKAIEIYEQPLDIGNYNMGHAVQMTRLVLEVYKMMREEEQEASSRDDGLGGVSDEFLDEFVRNMEAKNNAERHFKDEDPLKGPDDE